MEGVTREWLCSHQEAVLERLEAGVASPLRVGRRDAPDVGHVLQERREVVHLCFAVNGSKNGRGVGVLIRL